MFIDLGNHQIIEQDQIIAMIDVKSLHSSGVNREFLERVQELGKLVYCTDQAFVKSYVILENDGEGDDHPMIYATSFTTRAISEKRKLV
ncbi:MAG: DUF370 domain-containing protein [Tissierellia bacterium]|nr:DUF370 domain-containing protein [Tissierellia bacterium]